MPSRVVSDNGPHFSSACYADLSKKMSFRHVTSSPRYPRSNGLVERQIQTVKHVMKKAREWARSRLGAAVSTNNAD